MEQVITFTEFGEYAIHEAAKKVDEGANEWLHKNPDVKIVDRKVTSLAGRTGFYMTISIFYTKAQ